MATNSRGAPLATWADCFCPLSHAFRVHWQEEYKRQEEEAARLRREMAETERARARAIEEAIQAKEVLVSLSKRELADNEASYENTGARAC